MAWFVNRLRNGYGEDSEMDTAKHEVEEQVVLVDAPREARVDKELPDVVVP